ncbi:LOW QUALITY PROTEIN: uncharacterized protein RDI95_009266 [Morus bassanus]
MGPQAVARAASIAAFFLCKGLLGQHFDMVPDGVAESLRDLFLFPLALRGHGWWGTHASIYCCDREIIHLEGSLGTSPSRVMVKHSKSHLLRVQGPAKVLSRKGGLDAALQQRIWAAMDQALEYDAVTCNCVHFALSLLGLGQLTGTMMLSISERVYEMLSFLLFKCIPKHGAIFEEVPESKLQPGDILLFHMNIDSGLLRKSFKHATVYCGDREVIYFQNTSIQKNLGQIIKEVFNAMKRERGKC